MTAQADPYVRVYYRIADDPKFADVFDDDAALATWLRLLLTADAMYPAPAPIPQGTDPEPLATLVQAGLVELEGRGNRRFRIHGLEAEREERREAGRFAADVKHHGLAEALRRQSARTALAQRPQSASTADPMPLRSTPLQTSPLRGARGAPKLESIKEEDLPPFLRATKDD